MSELQNLNKKVLINLIVNCKKNNLNFSKPFDSSLYEDNLNILAKNSKWLGIDDVSSIDLDFVSSLYLSNVKLFESYFSEEISKESVVNNLKIPKLKNFNVEYTLIGSASKQEFWSQNVEGYNDEFIAKIIQLDYIDGVFDPYSGHFMNDETTDFEVDRIYIDDVEEVKNKLRESNLSKLIIENTQSVLDNLDLKTLLKLRDMINQKISS